MWQIVALGSLFSRACTDVADKAALVYDGAVDSLVATFYRQFIFLFLVCAVGYVGFLGSLSIFFSWEIFLYAVVTLPVCCFYTLLLRKIEVTGIEAAACLSPLIFLGIDVFLLHVGLSTTQIIAILILSVGGFAFAFDARTHRIKKEITWFFIFIFVYDLFQNVIEFYTFKHLNEQFGVNGVSFFVSSYILITLGALLLVLIAGHGRLLLNSVSIRYMRFASVGKAFDVSASLFWAQALAWAPAVSQVAAMMALSPLMVFAVTVITQKEMRVRLRERLDPKNLHWKAGAVFLLVLGTFLVG